ncbi:MAG: YbbR-like domain-containing protein [Firmicutes bacterium]|nr:YbbR-like domain-containing protein [Bacillota bacterium]
MDEDGHPVERVELSQPAVTVEAEKMLTKTVGVEVVTTGTAPEGTIVAPTSNLKLKIRGRYDDVKGISSLKTAPVNISGIKENTTVDVTVQLPPNITALDSGGDPIRNQTDDSVVIKVDFTVRTAADEADNAGGNDASQAAESGDNTAEADSTETDSGGTENDNNESEEGQQP